MKSHDSSLLTPLDRLLYRLLRLQGFQSQFVAVEGVRIHQLSKQGRAELPTLIFIHGIGAHAGHWFQLIPALARVGFPIVAIDLPDHGKSGPSDTPLTIQRLTSIVSNWLNGLRLQRSVLIGNSLGGGVLLKHLLSQKKSRSAPERLILLSPAGGFTEAEEWENFRNSIRIRNPEEALAFIRRVYHRVPPYASLVASGVVQGMNRHGVRDLIELTTIDDFRLPEDLESIPFPRTLVVWGESDRVFDHHQLDWFKTNLPAHRTEFLEPKRTGHCPQLDSPRWLNQVIREFAQRND